MTNTELLYKEDRFDVIELAKFKSEEKCKLCGQTIIEGFKAKDILSSKFTNYNICKCLDSEYMCEACGMCIKDDTLRKNNIIADKEHLYLLKKNDLEEYLFNLDKYVKDEFVIGITTSFKKHNSFRCRVNMNTEKFYIRQEDKEYLFDTTVLKDLYKLLNEAYLQFNKDEILSGNYNFISIEQFGIEKFQRYEEVFKKHRGTAQFELLVYMMNSEKRNEYIEKKKEEQKNAKIRTK